MTENKKQDSHNLYEIIRELFPDLSEKAFELIDEYEETLQKHGFDSSEAFDFYQKTVAENESMKEWLDTVYRLASCRDFPV